MTEAVKELSVAEQQDIQKVYSDGISRLMMGPAISKLYLHEVGDVQVIDGKQVAVAVTNSVLIMQTSVLIESCIKVLESAVKNKQLVESQQIEDIEKIKSLLAAVNFPQS